MKIQIVFLFGLSVFAAFGAEVFERVPVVDFARPEDGIGVRAVIGGPQAADHGAVVSTNGGFVHFWTGSNDASYVRFDVPAFERNLKSIPPARRSNVLYARMRVNRLPASGYYSFTVEAPLKNRYQISLQIPHPGEIETIPLYAELGWNRDKIRFDPAALVRGSLVTVGATDFELFEIGFLPQPLDAAVPEDAGKPRVDPDAFALYPEPRHAQISSEAVPLAGFGLAYACRGAVPKGAVRAFADEMKRFYGFDYRPSDDAQIVFEVADAASVPNYDRIRFDGFALVVAKTGVRLVAKDPKGLVYAATMLADAVKMTSGDTGAPAVRLFSVVDWPRLKYRPLQDMLRTHGHADKYEVPFYVEMLKRCAIDSRFNMFGFEPGAYYKWQSETNIPVSARAWDRREFESVVDWVNDRGMVAFPRMNGHGHVRHWPLAGKREAALYGEDDDTNVLCSRKAAQKEMTKAVFGEILDICSKNPAFAPKFFHIGYDEIRWQTDKLPEAQRCRLCAGVPKKELFLEQFMFLYDWCKMRGVRPVMCADMIRRYHNGLNAFRCAEVEPKIPKDVVYDNWATHDTFEIEETTKAGHENWKLLTAYNDNPIGEDFITGLGLNLCIYNWWLTHAEDYGLLAQRLLADSMWRAAPRVRFREREAKLARWGDYLIRNWSRKPIPQGTEEFDPVVLAGGSNWTGFAAMPSVTSFGKVPVAAPVTVEASARGAEITVGRRAASLCFLHAADFACAEDKMKFMSGRHAGQPMGGTPMAEYEVRYADGATEKVVVKYGWNVSDWTVGKGFGGVCACYPIDCRAVWRSAANAASLHEWVNPHPEKEISALRLRLTDTLARYALFALTARRSKP